MQCSNIPIITFSRATQETFSAELWKFAEALDDWLHALFAKPTPDWREALDQFLAWQEAEGYIVLPKSRQSIEAYLE